MPNVMNAIQSIFAVRLSAMRRKDEGATAVEYGLMVALIAGVIITAVLLLGKEVNKGFEKTCGAIQGANTAQTTAPAKCT